MFIYIRQLALLLFKLCFIKQQKLCFHPVCLWIRGPAIQGSRIIIVHLSQIMMHQLIEDIIGKIKHLTSAPEIPMQVNPLLPAILSAVSSVFVHKKLRSCKTEAVNALLDIPHHEQIMSPILFFGDCPKDDLLHQIAVLVFIDHNLIKMLTKLARSRCRLFCVLIYENVECKMLHIAKINNALFSLCRFHRSKIGYRKFHKCLRHGPQAPQLFQQLFRRHRKPLPQVLHILLHLRAESCRTLLLLHIPCKIAYCRQILKLHI